jgi:hypothetical protein
VITAAGALALAVPACAQILGAGGSFHEVDAGSGGAGGQPGTSSGASSSGAGGSPCGTLVNAAVEPCGPGTIGELTDDFDDDLTGSAWATYAMPETDIAIGEQSHEVRIEAVGKPSSFAGYVTKVAYALTGCQVSLEVKSVPPEANASTHLSFSPDPSAQLDVLEINANGDTLYLRKVVGGVETKHGIPYQPACHRFWRLREHGGTTYSEASPDGTSWYALGSDPTPAFATGGRVDFGLFVFESAPQPFQAVLDNFNVVP